MEDQKSRETLWHFLSLPLGIIVVFASTIGLGYVFEAINPPRNGTDSLPDFSNAITTIYIGSFLLVVGFIIWTIWIISDILKNRQNKSYIISNTGILLLPYLVFAGFALYNWILQKSYEVKKQSITRPVNYISLDTEIPNAAITYYISNDSAYIITSDINQNLNAAFLKKENTWQKLTYHVNLESLRYFVLANNTIHEIDNNHAFVKAQYKTTKNELLIATSPTPQREFYDNSDNPEITVFEMDSTQYNCLKPNYKDAELAIYDICKNKYAEFNALTGYNFHHLHRNSQNRTQFSDKNDGYFAFVIPKINENSATAQKADALQYTYIAHFNKKRSEVLRIRIPQSDMPIDEIDFSFKLGNSFYVLIRKRIYKIDI